MDTVKIHARNLLLLENAEDLVTRYRVDGSSEGTGGVLLVTGSSGGSEAEGVVAGWMAGPDRHLIEGAFGPWLFVGRNGGSRPPPDLLTATGGDMDLDGVEDINDRCLNTPMHQAVHRRGKYYGCAPGQIPDAEMAKYLEENGYDMVADYDGDGVSNLFDRCSNTSRGTSIARAGDWTGCARGQYRDKDVLNAAYQLAH